MRLRANGPGENLKSVAGQQQPNRPPDATLANKDEGFAG
jgi:hypothetical protein